MLVSTFDDDLTDDVMRAIHHRNIEDFGARRRSGMRTLVQTGLAAASAPPSSGLIGAGSTSLAPLPAGLDCGFSLRHAARARFPCRLSGKNGSAAGFASCTPVAASRFSLA